MKKSDKEENIVEEGRSYVPLPKKKKIVEKSDKEYNRGEMGNIGTPGVGITAGRVLSAPWVANLGTHAGTTGPYPVPCPLAL